jgi:hypothetical protein
MKIYDLDPSGRRAAIATLVGIPFVYAALVTAWIATGDAMYLPTSLIYLVLSPFVVRMLWIGLRTWTEVTAEGVTWSTPVGAATHFSPSGSVPADRIAAIAITPYKPGTKARAEHRFRLEPRASFAIVLHLLDRERIVLPITCGQDKVSRPMLQFLDAAGQLPDVPLIDVSPLAGIPRPRERAAKRKSPTP